MQEIPRALTQRYMHLSPSALASAIRSTRDLETWWRRVRGERSGEQIGLPSRCSLSWTTFAC